MASGYKWKPYRRRVATVEGVAGKFPVGSTVLFRGTAIGVVIGYDPEPEEPEVIFRYSADRGRVSQFSVRSPDYRRASTAAAVRPYVRDIDRLQFMAIADTDDLHPSIRLTTGTSASGNRFYSIHGDELAVLDAIVGIERGR